MNTKKIMFVDDEQDISRVVKMGLEQMGGYRVAAFNDSHEALSQFRAGLYDMIILDIKMPRINGFKLYHEIRKLDPSVKVAFMTAFEMAAEEFSKVFPSSDVRCLIKKPITAMELDRRIAEELQETLSPIQK